MNIQHYIDLLENRLSDASNPAKAEKMYNYMKGKACFFGINAPEFKKIFKDFTTIYGLPDPECMQEIITLLWEKDQREFQYAGMNMVFRMRKHLIPNDLSMIEHMVLNKSWWDTVDYIAAAIAGYFMKEYPEMINNSVDRWVNSNELWLQRTALLFQLKYKSETDEDLLRHTVIRLCNEKDFFIRKGIGWALREYSKTNPAFVLSLTEEIPLSPLSYKEARRIAIK